MSEPFSTIVTSTATSCATPTPISISHRSALTNQLLTPWIVHVFQGKPISQEEEDIEKETAVNTNNDGTTTVPSASSAASAHSASATSPIASTSPLLPFLPPTSKVNHDDHDLRVLSPEQTTFYANEYGKVEQQMEIKGVLESLRYCMDEENANSDASTSASTSSHHICQHVIFHQVSIRSVHSLIAELQEEQRGYDEQRRNAAIAASAVASNANATSAIANTTTTSTTAATSSHSSPPLHTIPTLVILNLCDGTEVDGYPGVSIARALQSTLTSSTPLAFTGADEKFFETTTDKRTMKRYFEGEGDDGSDEMKSNSQKVRTSRYVDLSDVDVTVPLVDEEKKNDHNATTTAASSSSTPPASSSPHSSYLHSLSTLTYPVIIKPTSSYSSCGLTTSSVCDTPQAALKQAIQLKKDMLGTGVIAEEFIVGREFSMLIVGNWDGKEKMHTAADASSTIASTAAASTIASSSYPHLRCYTPCERIFSSSLPSTHQFLTFEQNYPTKHTELQTWWSEKSEVTPEEHDEMIKQACSAYIACHGRSYGRIDIRQHSQTKHFYILEVNSQPGLSGEEDSSVGTILSHTRHPVRTNFGEFLYTILHLAVEGRLNRVV